MDTDRETTQAIGPLSSVESLANQKVARNAYSPGQEGEPGLHAFLATS